MARLLMGLCSTSDSTYINFRWSLKKASLFFQVYFLVSFRSAYMSVGEHQIIAFVSDSLSCIFFQIFGDYTSVKSNTNDLWSHCEWCSENDTWISSKLGVYSRKQTIYIYIYIFCHVYTYLALLLTTLYIDSWHLLHLLHTLQMHTRHFLDEMREADSWINACVALKPACLVQL